DFSVGRIARRVEVDAFLGKRPPLHAGFDIPEADAVAAAGEQGFAVGMKGDRVNVFRVPAQVAAYLAGGHGPESDADKRFTAVDHVTRGQGLAVRRKGGANKGMIVGGYRVQLLPAADIPDLDGLVPKRDRQRFAVRREGRYPPGAHRSRRPSQRGALLI